MFLMISMLWKRVTGTTLNLGDQLYKGKVGPLQKELNRAQFLLNSCITRSMFIAKNEHKSENWKMLGIFLCEVCHHLHK